MIPIDLIVSLFVFAIAIYTAHLAYRVINSLGIVRVERVLIFYLLVIAIDRMIDAISNIAGIPYPTRVNNIIWCLYIVGIALIVWEIYTYLTMTR
ncbi:MAG: hypothetical protein SVE93_07220 [Candidatus Thermoplasmatota archaeon]|nr:hypothetical protein [Candidatus Thermoplasmatota archaeon]